MCRYLKRLGVCLLVFLLASCSLWAFPSRKTQDAQSAETRTVIESAAPSESSAQVTGSMPSETSSAETTTREIDKTALEQAKAEAAATLVKYNDMKTIKGEDKDALLALFEAQVQDQMDAEAEIARLADRNEELEKANAKQADKIARETGSKAYVKITSAVGFENGLDNPSLWLGGAVGARIGSGFLMEAGANYRIGTFNDIIDSTSFGLDRLQITAAIGWEF